MRYVRFFAPFAILLAAAIVLSACRTAATISDYSPEAHQKAAELKAETLALMTKSDEPYARHRAEAEALTTKISAAYEVAASTPRNELVTQQWAVMKDPERDLYGGYVKRWQASGRISAAFRDEMLPQVSQAFDYILCLEVAKKSGGQCVAGGTP